jgi:hypothetical protein
MIVIFFACSFTPKIHTLELRAFRGGGSNYTGNNIDQSNGYHQKFSHYSAILFISAL